MVDPAFRVRPMFPLKAAYFCPPLPPVDSSPILQVLRVDLTPSPSQTTFVWLARPTSCEERRGSVQFLTLLFPPATLQGTLAEPWEPHQGGSSTWASGTLTPWPSALSRLTGLYQA